MSDMFLLRSLALDFIFVGIILIFLRKGYRDGLLQTVIYLVGYLVVFSVSIPLSKWIGEMVASLWRDHIYQSTLVRVHETTPEAMNEMLEQIFINFPTILYKLLPSLEMQAQWTRTIEEASTLGTQQLAGAITDEMLMPALTSILQMIFFSVTFVLCMFLVRMIAKSTRAVHGIPILGGVNRLGGAIAGAFKGGLFSIVFAIVTGLLLSFMDGSNSVLNNTFLIKQVLQLLPFS